MILCVCVCACVFVCLFVCLFVFAVSLLSVATFRACITNIFFWNSIFIFKYPQTFAAVCVHAVCQSCLKILPKTFDFGSSWAAGKSLGIVFQKHLSSCQCLGFAWVWFWQLSHLVGLSFMANYGKWHVTCASFLSVCVDHVCFVCQWGVAVCWWERMALHEIVWGGVISIQSLHWNFPVSSCFGLDRTQLFVHEKQFTFLAFHSKRHSCLPYHFLQNCWSNTLHENNFFPAKLAGNN